MPAHCHTHAWPACSPLPLPPCARSSSGSCFTQPLSLNLFSPPSSGSCHFWRAIGNLWCVFFPVGTGGDVVIVADERISSLDAVGLTTDADKYVVVVWWCCCFVVQLLCWLSADTLLVSAGAVCRGAHAKGHKRVGK